MIEIEKLNEAINILKNECSNNKECRSCIFCEFSNNSYFTDCKLNKNPCRWEILEEQKNGD